jgi:hypothetical protein
MNTITIPRALLEQALEALEGELPGWRTPAQERAITALKAALAQPVPHGCHVDLEEGMDPDGCVLDEGRPSNCIYARCLVREGKGKTDCEYWQPIEVKR